VRGWAARSGCGAELLQGTEPGVDAGVRDLRRQGPGEAGAAAPPRRGVRVALRGAPRSRVPPQPGGARHRGFAHARVALRGVLHRPPLAGAHGPRGPARHRPRHPREARLLCVADGASRGGAAFRGRGGPRCGHRRPPQPRGRADQPRPAAFGPHDATVVPGRALARRRRRRPWGARPAGGTARSRGGTARPPGGAAALLLHVSVRRRRHRPGGGNVNAETPPRARCPLVGVRRVHAPVHPRGESVGRHEHRPLRSVPRLPGAGHRPLVRVDPRQERAVRWGWRGRDHGRPSGAARQLPETRWGWATRVAQPRSGVSLRPCR
jgi:hypothetical protein